MRVDYKLKQKLERISEKNDYIDKKQKELDFMQNTFLRSPATDREPSVAKNTQRANSVLTSIAELSAEIDKLVDSYVAYRQELLTELERFGRSRREILYRFYFSFEDLGRIAEDTGYSERQLRRMLF